MGVHGLNLRKNLKCWKNLKKNFEKANVTNDDDILSLDESTIKSDFRTKKRIYRNGTKNILQKTGISYTVNFLTAVGINTQPILMDIKNLTEFEFGKALFKIKLALTNDTNAIKHINYILSLYDLSRKEITEILEEYVYPFCDFDGKIERSLKNNKKDNAPKKARKLQNIVKVYQQKILINERM